MRLVRGLPICFAIAAACAEGTGESRIPTSLVIAPDTGWLLLGGERQLSAALADSTGDPLPPRRWSGRRLLPLPLPSPAKAW